jgi:hypothetical protein
MFKMMPVKKVFIMAFVVAPDREGIKVRYIAAVAKNQNAG